eukprot:12397762-Karenia_brevis.AAC.1
MARKRRGKTKRPADGNPRAPEGLASPEDDGRVAAPSNSRGAVEGGGGAQGEVTSAKGHADVAAAANAAEVGAIRGGHITSSNDSKGATPNTEEKEGTGDGEGNQQQSMAPVFFSFDVDSMVDEIFAEFEDMEASNASKIEEEYDADWSMTKPINKGLEVPKTPEPGKKKEDEDGVSCSSSGGFKAAMMVDGGLGGGRHLDGSPVTGGGAYGSSPSLNIKEWPALPPFPAGKLMCPQMIALPNLMAHGGTEQRDDMIEMTTRVYTSPGGPSPELVGDKARVHTSPGGPSPKLVGEKNENENEEEEIKAGILIVKGLNIPAASKASIVQDLEVRLAACKQAAAPFAPVTRIDDDDDDGPWPLAPGHSP